MSTVSKDDLKKILLMARWKKYLDSRKAKHLAEAMLLDKKGEPVWNHAIHENIQDFIDYAWEKGKHAVVLVSMGHGKTEQLYPRIIREIHKDHNVRIGLITEAHGQAKDRIQAIRKYVDEYKGVLGLEYEGRPTESDFTVIRDSKSKDETLSGYGAFADVTGKRLDIEIFDDIETYNNTYIKNVIQKLKDSFELTHLTRLEPGGRVLVIGTKYSDWGLLADLEKDSRFFTLIISLNDDLETYTQKRIEFGEIVDQIILPRWKYQDKEKFREVLDNKPLLFRIAYQMDLEAREVAMTFRTIAEVQIDEKKSLDFIETAKRDGIHKLKSIDLSGSKRAGTVVTTGVVNKKMGKVLIAKAEYYKISWWDLSEIILKENDEETTWIIEDNGMQDNLITTTRKRWAQWNELAGGDERNIVLPELRIIKHTTGRNKNSIDSGLVSLDDFFKQMMILFNADDHGVEKIINEIMQFQTGKGYFDGLMTVWFISLYMKRFFNDVKEKSERLKRRIRLEDEFEEADYFKELDRYAAY